jgi:hypothetical protein
MQDKATGKPATHFGETIGLQEMWMQGISQLTKGKDGGDTRCKVGNGDQS